MVELAALRQVGGFLLRNWKAVAMIILVILLCAHVESCTANKYELRLSRSETALAKQMVRLEERRRKQEQDWLAYNASIDELGTQALREKQIEIDRLRADLAADRSRLRVKARCPAAVPEAPTAPSLGGGEGAVLDPGAEQDYLALREGIGRLEVKLDACQNLLTNP